MNGQRLTRRMVLGALMVGLTILAGPGMEIAEAVNRIDDYASKAQFEDICKNSLKGEWVETKDANGNTTSTGCYEKDGGAIVCGGNGKDCTYFPPARKAEPVGPFDSHVETGGEATTEVGATAPLAPVVDSRPLQNAQPVFESVQEPVQEFVQEPVQEPVVELVTEPVAVEPVAESEAPVEEQP